jgi:hypothetical protein
VGNEGNVETYANFTGLMWEQAPRFGALIVFAEVSILIPLSRPARRVALFIIWLAYKCIYVFTTSLIAQYRIHQPIKSHPPISNGIPHVIFYPETPILGR